MSKSNKEAASEDASDSMKNLAKLLLMLGAEDRTSKPASEHKFWKTQPVTQPGDSRSLPRGAIAPSVPPEKVRQEPLPLPSDFEWVTVDVDKDEELSEVYHLLTMHYVEDDDATMRFKYSLSFLQWALRHPGYDKSWHVGVRVKSTQKLVAFIAGIPQELRVRDEMFQVVEINFLCVHKRLRSKRLAPVLIKEVTRRCNLRGIFQAIYTAGQVLPTPMSCARYYHRTLRASKLVDIGFSAVPHGMSRAEHEARYVLPTQTSLPGLRVLQADDVPAVARLLRRYMARYDMAPRFTDAEVRHLFLSGQSEKVTWAYVVETEGRITDFFSFYSLPSSVLNHREYETLEAAYLFYYATESAFASSLPPASDEHGPSPNERAMAEGLAAWQRTTCSRLDSSEAADEEGVPTWSSEPRAVKERLQARLRALMQDMLVLANNEGFDVVNCLTVMDNAMFVTDLKFGPGDGFLNFYLFNWRVTPVAGGLGARANDQEHDPAAHDAEVPRPPSVYGSGNGVVMV
ncbi:glycylpeptide N-tetradecanoyltransferase [Malassezia pachydermatis]|uniref:Glycylpeptide N-tetradecanoyltransferase n=1 Tax=Malassezia pachydermatis TaxID=77020 RepID=A0A0M9VMT4_9BASI|nr:n-myristoyl transferase [Malassezia pachydermatis]KOS12573.1 n-myristoyl transferase [Malassezia pachydermatis]